MGERRAGRFRLGRRRPDDEVVAAKAPCVPCGQQAALRTFALNQRTVDRIGDDFVASLDPEVAHAIADGEVVLFDPRTRSSSLLNATAALIWASVDGQMTVAEIADDLALETGADRGVIESDVRETLARFIDGGVVVNTLDEPAGDPELDDPDLSSEGASRARAERRQHLIDGVLARRTWQLDDVRRCSGATVAIRTDSAELAALLAPALAPIASPGPADTTDVTISILDRGRDSLRRFRFLRGSQTRLYATTVEGAFDAFFSELNDLAIDQTRGRIVLHAGAVERDGSIVLVAGASGRGKTTLTAALVQAGWGYLTDEVAAVDPVTLAVLPYAKPLDLNPSSCELLGIDAIESVGPKAKVGIDRIGLAADGGGRVALLVLLDDPLRPSLSAAPSSAERLVEILGNTFAPTFDNLGGAQAALDALAGLALTVPVLTLGRTPIAEAVATIDEQVQRIDRAAKATGEPPVSVAR